MAQQAKHTPWNRRHRIAGRPDPSAPVEQAGGRVAKPKHPCNSIQYGHVVRLADETYEYLRGMRRQMLARVEAAADRDVLLLPAMGKLIDAALREYAPRHGIEPQATGG